MIAVIDAPRERDPRPPPIGPSIEPALAAVLGVVDQVLPIERADVEQAAGVLNAVRVSARDGLHVTVMRRHGMDRVMTFVRGFDAVAGIRRYQRR